MAVKRSCYQLGERMKTQRLLIMIAVLTAMAIHLLGVGVAVAFTPAEILQMSRETGIPDYFNTPNYAYSPPLRKFVDTLPGLGLCERE